MTIVVGVAAPDGLILAADSRMTYAPHGGRGRTRVGSDSTQKVFSVWDRFGVACYGAGFVKDKTVTGQMSDFEASFGEPQGDVEQFASELEAFFAARMGRRSTAAGKPWESGEERRLGFLVAGYDVSGVGRLLDVRVPEPGGAAIFPSGPSTENIGATWRGQDDVLNRLMAGFDSDLLKASKVHVPPVLDKALAEFEYSILPPITTQDAVDCAVFLIRTTIGMQRFCDGTRALPGRVPGCGGPIRVLNVARRAVEWVSRPSLTLDDGAGSAA
jgi:hypothetical protein